MEGRAPILPSIFRISSASRSCSEQKRFLSFQNCRTARTGRRLSNVRANGLSVRSMNSLSAFEVSVSRRYLRNHFQFCTLSGGPYLTIYVSPR